MTFPKSLFYYYESGREPFLSISELDSSEFEAVMNHHTIRLSG
ncbi:MAG TPA: hypothetical protein VJ998_03945 [Pseudomonadales bacterium]|nr:hypothetical protein [Pseudomonadales bacterium]